jgi:hypothetical protein
MTITTRSRRAAHLLLGPLAALARPAAVTRAREGMPATISEKAGIEAIVASERTRSEAARKQLARLARGRGPIVVGPWVREVGFELLYWIPFLRWAQETFELAPERLIVVSRGGTAAWYRHITDRYAEIFEYITPEELLAANDREAQERGRLKQTRVSALDRRLVDLVTQRLGLREADLLHPSLVYRLYMPYWRRRAPLEHVEEHSACRPLRLADAPRLPGLPEKYVAMKFHFNPSFPATKANRAFVTRVLDDLASRTDVVLLNGGLRFDDGAECLPASLDRIHRIDSLMTPGTNLAVQTQVVAGADAFVGTYGGLSYLAPFYGVDSLAFYSNRHKLGPQLDLAHRAFSALGGASFVALDTRDRDAVVRLSPQPKEAESQGRGRRTLSSSVHTRVARAVPVHQPLILISQIQRSGGTLMTRLFDGHPECWTHPYELHWGRPRKYDWPDLELGPPDEMFSRLEERWVGIAVARGFYTKKAEPHPFIFDCELQKRIFEERLAEMPPARRRDVLDAYLTSLFNAWLDCQGIYQGPKRFAVAFTPRVCMTARRRQLFWEDYPDGYLISIVREPVGWFASARRHKPEEYSGPDEAVLLWRQSVEGTLAAHAEHPDRVNVVTFEDLLQKTESVMRRICDRMQLPFVPSLLCPTYNGQPVESNSSFESRHELDPAAVDRSRDVAPEEAERVRQAAGDLYAQVCERFALRP